MSYNIYYQESKDDPILMSEGTALVAVLPVGSLKLYPRKIWRL